MNDNDNNNDNNFYKIMAYVFIGIFLISMVIFFACLFILNGLKVNILIIIIIIIIIKYTLIIIKNQSYYYWNDAIYIDDFDIKYLKINKRESRAGIDIYYIGYVLYKLKYIMNSVVPLYLNVKSMGEVSLET